MTYEQRERIFSKEIITIGEFMELFSVDKSGASQMMGNIRRGIEFSGKELRLKKAGQLHIQDFFDYYRLNPADYRPSTSIALAKELVSAAVAEFVKPLTMVSGGGGKEETSCETH